MPSFCFVGLGVFVCDEDRDFSGVGEYPVEPAGDAVVEGGVDERPSESSCCTDEEQRGPVENQPGDSESEEHETDKLGEPRCGDVFHSRVSDTSFQETTEKESSTGVFR